jgi:hypothetical protein
MLGHRFVRSNLYRRMISTFSDTDVVVCGFARTPIGSINGQLASLTAPRLGAAAIKAAVNRSGIDKNLIEEVFMGNVVSAGIGQAPSRQASIYADLPIGTAATDINKVSIILLRIVGLYYLVCIRSAPRV